jgi:hypothetical protein
VDREPAELGYVNSHHAELIEIIVAHEFRSAGEKEAW